MKFFSLIYQGEIHPATNEKVIHAEAFSTLMGASEILAQCKEEAEHYKKQIEKQCEELKENAKKEGFSEGLFRFNEHLIHFDKQLRLIRLELQKQILPLALKAAKKIVG